MSVDCQRSEGSRVGETVVGALIGKMQKATSIPRPRGDPNRSQDHLPFVGEPHLDHRGRRIRRRPRRRITISGAGYQPLVGENVDRILSKKYGNHILDLRRSC